MGFKNRQKPENLFSINQANTPSPSYTPAPVTNPKEKDVGPSVFGSGDRHQGSNSNLCLNGDMWLSTPHITEMPPVQGGGLDSSGLACGTKQSPGQMLAILCSPTKSPRTHTDNWLQCQSERSSFLNLQSAQYTAPAFKMEEKKAADFSPESVLTRSSGKDTMMLSMHCRPREQLTY